MHLKKLFFSLFQAAKIRETGFIFQMALHFT